MSLHTVDVEELTSAYLAGVTEISALVETRVVTAMPNRAVFPLLRLTLIGGAPAWPLYLDRPVVQFDAYGGPKKLARTLMDRTCAALEAMTGSHPQGVVSGVTFHERLYLPDAGYDPAQPRYTFSASIFTHPAKEAP